MSNRIDGAIVWLVCKLPRSYKGLLFAAFYLEVYSGEERTWRQNVYEVAVRIDGLE